MLFDTIKSPEELAIALQQAKTEAGYSSLGLIATAESLDVKMRADSPFRPHLVQVIENDSLSSRIMNAAIASPAQAGRLFATSTIMELVGAQQPAVSQ